MIQIFRSKGIPSESEIKAIGIRPQIAFFYCIGIWLSVRPLNMPSWWKPAAIGALVALCVHSALWPEAVNNS